MKTALEVVLILISVILMAVILMQSRGAGFGGAFGVEGAVFRTRRGVERYLFRGTVILAALFIVIALLSARANIVS